MGDAENYAHLRTHNLLDVSARIKGTLGRLARDIADKFGSVLSVSGAISLLGHLSLAFFEVRPDCHQGVAHELNQVATIFLQAA